MLHLAFPSPRSWQPPIFVLPPRVCLFPNVAGWKHTARILLGRTFSASEHASENTELLTSFSQGRASRGSRIPSQGQSTPSPSVISRATMETKIGSPRNSQTGLTCSGFQGQQVVPSGRRSQGQVKSGWLAWAAHHWAPLPQASPVPCKAGSALGCSVRPGAKVAQGQVRLPVLTKYLPLVGRGCRADPTRQERWPSEWDTASLPLAPWRTKELQALGSFGEPSEGRGHKG